MLCNLCKDLCYAVEWASAVRSFVVGPVGAFFDAKGRKIELRREKDDFGRESADMRI